MRLVKSHSSIRSAEQLLAHPGSADWSPLIYNESLDTSWHVATSTDVAVSCPCWWIGSKKPFCCVFTTSALLLPIFQTEHCVGGHVFPTEAQNIAASHDITRRKQLTDVITVTKQSMILILDFPENFKDSYILVKTGFGFSTLTLCVCVRGEKNHNNDHLLHSK